jgi:hypothetical protein
MNTPAPSSSPRGYVVASQNIPHGFGAHLERAGLAGMTARTVDGMYFEPRVPLTAVFAAFDRCGIQVHGVRRAGGQRSWRESARPAWRSRDRLANRQSAEWLPTLPAA